MNKVNSSLILKAAILLLTAATILTAGCSREQKYTYEEYRKLKAFSENDKTSQFSNESLDNKDLESYHNDLNSYNLYMSDSTAIYSTYSLIIMPLFEDFDNEQEDLDKKNEFASEIKQHLQHWINDLNELSTPDIIKRYHEQILIYLEKEILFYDSFLKGDSELADSYMTEASSASEKSNEELISIENDLIQRSQQLNIDPPF